jgi:Ca2+-transporting ATPase
VRQRAAIEALGSVTVLCTDKTGTLTENRMRVVEVDDDSSADLDALGVAALAAPPLSQDPMDHALRAAMPDAAGGLRLLREYSFSAARRSVGIAWSTGDGRVRLACKGAPEAIVAACRLPSVEAEAIDRRVAEMAARGLRVLGVAEAIGPSPPANLEDALFKWCGLVAFADPLRAGVRDAVGQARSAGIRVVMLTGDHAGTACAIGREAGLAHADTVLPGDVLSDDATALKALATTNVFARVRPQHKLRLVELLQRKGEVVAMTGDGVNDAPALAAAHVGVAMGGRGTDVAREASAIVLVDDNFTTLVHAVAEGRRIYDNMRRAVRYILAVHVPITCLAMFPVLLGVPPVLAPIHIVLLQLIIDPVCSIVFESDAAGPDIMRRPPRPPSQRLVSVRRLIITLLQGLAMFLPVAAVDYAARRVGWPLTEVRALDFTALVAGNLALILLYRPGRTVLDVLASRNLPFLVAGSATLVMLTLGTQNEAVGGWLDFAPPPFLAWAGALTIPFLLAAGLKGFAGYAGKD